MSQRLVSETSASNVAFFALCEIEPIPAQMPITHGPPRIASAITMTSWRRPSSAERVRRGWQPRQP
jgi:hypothetical protein